MYREIIDIMRIVYKYSSVLLLFGFLVTKECQSVYHIFLITSTFIITREVMGQVGYRIGFLLS